MQKYIIFLNHRRQIHFSLTDGAVLQDCSCFWIAFWQGGFLSNFPLKTGEKQAVRNAASRQIFLPLPTKKNKIDECS